MSWSLVCPERDFRLLNIQSSELGQMALSPRKLL
jgi:hypothetical protein